MWSSVKYWLSGQEGWLSGWQRLIIKFKKNGWESFLSITRLGFLGVLCGALLQITQVHWRKRIKIWVWVLLDVFLWSTVIAFTILRWSHISEHTLPTVMDEAHIFLMRWGEEFPSVSGRTRAWGPLVTVHHPGSRWAGHSVCPMNSLFAPSVLGGWEELKSVQLKCALFFLIFALFRGSGVKAVRPG